MDMSDCNDKTEYYLSNILGLVIIDMEGNVIYANEQFIRCFGMEGLNILDKPITEVFPQTKMMEGLYIDEPEIVFYNDGLGIGISVQIPLFRDGKRFGLMEYDVVQASKKLYDLSREYSDFLERELLNVENALAELESAKYTINNIIGKSSAVINLKKKIISAAKTSSTVIITGETGTGKELVAHAIHNLSDRRKEKIVKINASAIPENLVEAELFGYEEGSFTGASRGGRKGKFELSDKGTLFIDEINQMPAFVQTKILRVLQEMEVDRIGSDESIPVDVRVIVATNEDLEDLVKRNRFREDLYYRFNVIQINIPPLRERKEDIEELVVNRVKELSSTIGIRVHYIDPKVFDKLKRYDWPGNIRELYNVVERAMNFASDDRLTEKEFDIAFMDNHGSGESPTDGSMSKKLIDQVRDDAEKKLIMSVLKRFDNNKTKTAEFLNVARPLLYQKIKRLNID